jgi:ATP-dependent DNA ligase
VSLPDLMHATQVARPAWAEVLHRGYEGMVAKDPDSKYLGGRTLKWLKLKQPKYREGERGWEPKGKS